mgnify:CR=1 FL=1
MDFTALRMACFADEDRCDLEPDGHEKLGQAKSSQELLRIAEAVLDAKVTLYFNIDLVHEREMKAFG